MPLPFLRCLLAAATVAGLAACATKPPVTDTAATQEYQENNDPFEPANRVGYAINDGLDTYFLAPVARAYRYAVPGVIREPVHNVLQNLTTPRAVHQRRGADQAAACRRHLHAIRDQHDRRGGRPIRCRGQGRLPVPRQ